MSIDSSFNIKCWCTYCSKFG